MSKSPIIHPDPLVMKVRAALREKEPREMPTERRRNSFGFECWVCPRCGELCYMKGGSGNLANYNMHFAHKHGIPFWREHHIINVLRKELQA